MRTRHVASPAWLVFGVLGEQRQVQMPAFTCTPTLCLCLTRCTACCCGTFWDARVLHYVGDYAMRLAAPATATVSDAVCNQRLRLGRITISGFPLWLAD